MSCGGSGELSPSSACSGADAPTVTCPGRTSPGSALEFRPGGLAALVGPCSRRVEPPLAAGAGLGVELVPRAVVCPASLPCPLLFLPRPPPGGLQVYGSGVHDLCIALCAPHTGRSLVSFCHHIFDPFTLYYLHSFLLVTTILLSVSMSSCLFVAFSFKSHK